MKLTRKAAVLFAAVPVFLFVAPVGTASAHGYVSSPASRSAQCAAKTISCGAPTYEPQSAEGPKGLKNCSGARGDFAELDNDNKGWQVHSTGSSLTLSWAFTARHRTRDYEYYIGGTRVGFVDGGNAAPVGNVSHTINLGGFTGRQKLYAIWNIGDTAAAFYSCIDLQIGGGGNPNPPTSNPPTPPPAGGTWAANTAYATGATVTYGGASYRCRQAHTSLTGWEPPNAASLWERI
ncbi:lytic polysaccharide monooxygenase [Lentzea sp. NPDC051213]|uniref:lytic polysaccharide monooxygenase n=1 Tax=Lentzea sp. NPDC051213 TaxID=3364126 RepID=UPI003789B3BC